MKRSSFLIVIHLSALLVPTACVSPHSSLGSNGGGGSPSSTHSASSSTSDAASQDNPVVTDCKANTDVAGTHCAAQPERLCLYTGYDKLCETERAAAISASMACFTTSTCHTFSDPGETAVQNCLAGVKAQYTTDASTAVENAVNAKCAGSGIVNLVKYPPVPYFHLSDTLNATLLSCVQAATDCSGACTCITSVIPLYASCPN